jgi:NADH-quinone oxidoreductase subunit L
MFAALGVGAPAAALFHVVTHACFKALLFLGCGSVIHGMHEKQDMFEMGGLRKHMPWTHLTFAIATAAIIGFPLSSGFFSKDMILAKAFEHGPLPFAFLLGAALLTAFYMLRAYTLTFWGAPRSKEAEHAHESSPLLLAPLAVLAFLSVFVGWIETPVVFHGPALLSEWMKASWYGFEPVSHGHLSHATEWALMAAASTLSLLVAWFSFVKYRNYGKVSPTYTGVAKVSENKFFVDEIYVAVIVRPLRGLAALYTRFIDGGVVNGFLHFTTTAARTTGQVLALFHTGSVQAYAWYLAAGTALLILFAKGLFQ